MSPTTAFMVVSNKLRHSRAFMIGRGLSSYITDPNVTCMGVLLKICSSVRSFMGGRLMFSKWVRVYPFGVHPLYISTGQLLTACRVVINNLGQLVSCRVATFRNGFPLHVVHNLILALCMVRHGCGSLRTIHHHHTAKRVGTGLRSWGRALESQHNLTLKRVARVADGQR